MAFIPMTYYVLTAGALGMGLITRRFEFLVPGIRHDGLLIRLFYDKK
jgi:hypothetical protein